MKRYSLFAAALGILSFAMPVVRADDKPEAKKPASVTPSIKNDAFVKRHEGFLKDKEEALKNGPVNVLFVGDSITDAWRREPHLSLFKEKWGKYNPLNIGIGGDRTQHVLWRLENGEVEGIKPKVAVLMIGTNNLGNKESVADTIAGVKAVVKSLRDKLPETKVLLLAIFPRGEKADNPFRAQIKEVNDAIAKLDDGKRIKYLDIGPKFLTEDGTLTKEIMPDALHPNAKGYQIWADAISAEVDEMAK